MTEREIKLRAHNAATVNRVHNKGLTASEWASYLRRRGKNEEVIQEAQEILSMVRAHPEMSVIILPHGDVENDSLCINCCELGSCNKKGTKIFSVIQDIVFGRWGWGFKPNTIIKASDLLEHK